MSKVLTTADWHIRSTVPSCLDMTQDGWMYLQEHALQQIVDIAIKEKVEGVYVGGDLTHSEPTTSFECIHLIQWVAQTLNGNGIKFRIMTGNHDSKYHSSAYIHESAIGVIMNSKDIILMSSPDSLIHGCNFDVDIYDGYEKIFKHVLCMPEEVKLPMIDCETPQTLLERYPDAKYIYVGDYHRRFHFESKDHRHVINSGCLTKQASDFEDYTCGIWVTDFDTDEIIWHEIKNNYVFNHNGEEKKQRDKDIQNFASSIKKESVSLDFISSVKAELPNHEKSVQDKVNGWIEEIGQ